LWTTTYSAEVTVDVAIWARYCTPFSEKLGAIPPERLMTTINIPDSVHVGTATPLHVNNRPADSKWTVSDTSLARITPNESLVARHVGQVIVSLMSALKPGLDPYATKQVEILP